MSLQFLLLRPCKMLCRYNISTVLRTFHLLSVFQAFTTGVCKDFYLHTKVSFALGPIIAFTTCFPSARFCRFQTLLLPEKNSVQASELHYFRKIMFTNYFMWLLCTRRPFVYKLFYDFVLLAFAGYFNSRLPFFHAFAHCFTSYVMMPFAAFCARWIWTHDKCHFSKALFVKFLSKFQKSRFTCLFFTRWKFQIKNVIFKN